MKRLIAAIVLALAAYGVHLAGLLPVDVFPDIAVPRVTIQSEAGGYTAEEVEELVTIPVETAMSGLTGLSTVRSSSGGGLSFVWLDFDWSSDLTRARFDVFERLARVRELLPSGVETEIAPVVSVTGEIMLVALTSESEEVTPLELREIAEYDLRQRLLGVPGIGEVAVIGGKLPEYRVSVDPSALAGLGLSVSDVIESARDTRTRASAGYLANVYGDEIPLRQIARADTLAALKSSALPLSAGSMRLGDVAEVTLSGAPRRGSASFDGKDAVVLSVQKVPGGNTTELTAKLDAVLADFSRTMSPRGVQVHANAYRQADFIDASVHGAGVVVRDAMIVVAIVLLLTLLEWRTILIVLITMPISILLGLTFFPLLGLGVNVMTLGGVAVAAGDIVDAAIIFTDAIRRKLPLKSVVPGVLFSTLIVALVFVPLLMLDGLEGCFFRPLALAFLCVFVASLVAALTLVPVLGRLIGLAPKSDAGASDAKPSLGIRLLTAVYRPFLSASLKLPYFVVLTAFALAGGALYLASDFGSSFLPPFREDSFNVALSLPPGASLAETERVSEACVPAIASIPGVKSVTRRTGRAERDQHAEPVSSSEYVVRVDLAGDPDHVKAEIRRRLGDIPGCSLLVGYPIAHRISAVLSGTEAEIAINVYGEDAEVLREVVGRMKKALAEVEGVSDVRANREVMVRTLRIDYDIEALREAGLTLREAGEQVSAAFYGLEVGEVREGLKRRAVVVRLAGDEDARELEDVRKLLLTSRTGRSVRLDEVARVEPEDASNLMLREGGRRKALISCNAADGIPTGDLVRRLEEVLSPIAAMSGCSVSFGGSCQARASAAKRLSVIGIGLTIVVFVILVFALKRIRLAVLALVNIPLGLIGGIVAVKIADPVLSVSSLVGFITVIGFVMRNGLLLLNRYQERIAAGDSVEAAIRMGSLERMPPIVMTSLTTVFGLIPIMLAGDKPGGELLAPLAIVQFGGLLGATILNLLVVPSAAKLLCRRESAGKCASLIPLALLVLSGCKSYERKPIDWTAEATREVPAEVTISSLEQVAALAIIGNRDLNEKRLKVSSSDAVAGEIGWWDDPELDCDLLRVVNPEEYPWLGGLSISFTLPVSGVKNLERIAAERYAEADRAEILVAETETAVEARENVIRLAGLFEMATALERVLEDSEHNRALENAAALAKAGEVTTADLSAARRRVHQREHQLAETKSELLKVEAELRKLLALDPRTRLHVPTSAILHDEHSHETPAPVDPLSLVAHPRVKAALARLEADEASLETEIRRQYPDLKFGPSYSYEDGNDRFGLVVGLSLPLWNRNRRAIAEAEGKRELTRLEAIDVWREIVSSHAAALQSAQALVEHHDAPMMAAETAARLARAGEIGPLDYLALIDEALEAELAEIEWRRESCLAREEIERYSVR